MMQNTLWSEAAGGLCPSKVVCGTSVTHRGVLGCGVTGAWQVRMGLFPVPTGPEVDFF